AQRVPAAHSIRLRPRCRYVQSLRLLSKPAVRPRAHHRTRCWASPVRGRRAVLDVASLAPAPSSPSLTPSQSHPPGNASYQSLTVILCSPSAVVCASGCCNCAVHTPIAQTEIKTELAVAVARLSPSKSKPNPWLSAYACVAQRRFAVPIPISQTETEPAVVAVALQLACHCPDRAAVAVLALQTSALCPWTSCSFRRFLVSYALHRPLCNTTASFEAFRSVLTHRVHAQFCGNPCGRHS
ncbi:hypothetical protein EXIGLDRAFT_828432, partial [Exidia glandulosa HHB12029]